jgi:hypothetical protein
MDRGLSIFTHLHLYMVLMLLLIFPATVSATDLALVLRGASDDFTMVLKGISDDLEDDLKIIDYIVDDSTAVEKIGQLIVEKKPKALVIMGNKALNLYGKYQKQNPDIEHLPSLLIAALFIDKYIPKLSNIVGIRYEVPAVTSIVNLRSILSKPILRVGVIHRKWMSDFVEENRSLCKAEGIELISLSLPDRSRSYSKAIRKRIRKLETMNINAFWILNDNVLLNRALLRNAWIPSLNKLNKPVIVGVESLVLSKLDLGTFAIVPDHYALGVQGATTLLDLMENNWVIKETKIEQPLSVKKLLNLSLSKKRKIPINIKRLGEVDVVIE